jgi:hypothetical protein
VLLSRPKSVGSGRRGCCGALDPAKLVHLLVGLDREGLRQWAEVNPDGAALLAGYQLLARSANGIVLGSSLRNSEMIMQ